MAGKLSTLTWDEPPTGGSDITGYRILVFEGDALAVILTTTEAAIVVEHSETLERTALVQAENAQGFSVPLVVSIPAASAPDDGSGS